MPAGINVTIDGSIADVEVPDPVLRRKVAARLVAAAKPDSWRVDIRTVGVPVPTFRAPTSVVEAAGLIDQPAPEAPPRTGKGATTEAWQQYLTARGIPWDADDSRAALIARWDNMIGGAP